MTKFGKRLGLGANPQKRQDIELAKEKAQLRRKLSLFGRRRRENEDEKTEIYDDSDESESKSKYIEKISLLKQSKEHAGSDNEKRTTNSYFDMYKRKKKENINQTKNLNKRQKTGLDSDKRPLE